MSLSPDPNAHRGSSSSERALSAQRPSGPLQLLAAGARKRLCGFAVFTGILALVYLRVLFHWLQVGLGADLHSHTLLVPFVTAYLIWIRRNQLPSTFVTSISAALPLLTIGIFATASAAFSSFDVSDQLALRLLGFLFLLSSGVLFFFGKQYLKAILFPAAFLLFAVPLPDQLVDALETGSKLASAEAAELFFSATGTTYMREATTFVLPGITLEVAQECSGIRSSLILLVTGAFAANLLLRSTWRRWFLVAVVIPLGILRNGFRILTIGLLCVHIGPHMIHSVIHNRGGPVFFALSLIPLLAIVWWLRRGESKKPGINGSEDEMTSRE